MFQGRPLAWQTYHFFRTFGKWGTPCVQRSTVHLPSQFSRSRASKWFKPTGCHKELDILWHCQQVWLMRLQTCHSTLSWHQLYHWPECRNLWALRYSGLISPSLMNLPEWPGFFGFPAFSQWLLCHSWPKNLCSEHWTSKSTKLLESFFFWKMLALGCIFLANCVSFFNRIQDVPQVWSKWCLNLPIQRLLPTGLPGFTFEGEDSQWSLAHFGFEIGISKNLMFVSSNLQMFKILCLCAFKYDKKWAFSFLALL